MRVDGVNNIIAFGKCLPMAIPTDIGKGMKNSDITAGSPTFGIKPIPVTICDSFVHVLK